MTNDPNHLPTSPGSPSDDPILAELADRPKRPWLVFAAGLFVFLLIIGLAVGPLLYFALPGEITRWRIASAEEKRLNGDLDGAIQDLNRALEKEPNDFQLLTKRAEWNKERKDYAAALQDCNQLIQIRPDNVELLLLRSTIYQHLGRHREAINDLKKILKLQGGQTQERALALNNLAYARAIADVEIDEGLAEIDEAIRLAGEHPSFVDTRGYLYYRQADFDRALNDLERAAANMQEQYGDWLARTEKGRLGAFDRREMELQAKENAQSVAVVLYHRMLVYEGMGQKEKAEQDRKRILELGFQPSDELF